MRIPGLKGMLRGSGKTGPIGRTPQVFRPRALVRRTVFAAGVLLLIVQGAVAQVSPALFDYPRTDLDWFSIETDHFYVHYHGDDAEAPLSHTAQVVAAIAEAVYLPITDLYQYEPDTKVSIILKDFEDYSNGAAYFFDNKIEIWVPSLDAPLRGEHNWLRNVITHEFTHIIQVQKTMKAGRRWPVTYLQWLNYEDVKRPDVLYGYPNGIVSYPIPILNNPAWLAEGTAQYQRAGLHYDAWDTHRDMLLRTQVLDDAAFSLAEMGSFQSKTSLQRESIYNHGFAFSHYLAHTYGEDVLRRLSESLSKWRNWNVERALTEATGDKAADVYAGWMRTLKADYEARVGAIGAQPVAGTLIEAEGFSNHFPVLSPDGKQVAYLSNRGEDYNLISLYVQDLDTGTARHFPVEGLELAHFVHTCALEGRLLSGVNGSVDWHPDGKKIVFSRLKDNAYGHRYADLYELDLDTEDVTRLTTEARAAAPAYAPDGKAIVFVAENNGSRNLHRLDLDAKTITPLTTFTDGTQVYDPAWHPSGDWIYFGRAYFEGRDLYRIRPNGQDQEAVWATPHDERQPTFDAEGKHLLFASDASGIYNLYRLPVDALGGPELASTAAGQAVSGVQPTQLTNVVGGAFMPDVGPEGQVAYALYATTGYKIALLETPAPVTAGRYTPPDVLQKPAEVPDAQTWAALNQFDDRPVMRAGEEAVAQKPYENVFTSFQFYPVLRFDMYADARRNALDAEAARRFQAGTVLRNTKTGLYMGSREVLEGLSLFGGLLVGPASLAAESVGDFFAPSRLIRLERDAFLQLDYKKGIPLIPQRWSPQLSIELYSIRRHVENGLTIEEFPCTACYPDTTFTDVAYSLWEVDGYARSKLNRSTLLELGYRYSPYRVRTESFFSEENRQTIEGSATRYFIGHGPTLKLYYEAQHPHINSEVVPEGLKAEVGYDVQFGQLLDRFAVESGVLVPEYDRFSNHRLSLDVRYGRRLGMTGRGAHGLGVRVRTSSILGGEVDDFFNDYVGGLIGARGYPFYALGGNEVIWTQVAYHFPIVPKLGMHFLFLDLDKLYGRVYADAALAWTGPWPGLGAARKDLGAELRLGIGSFYLFPTALFVSATYGLDRFDFKLDEGFFAPDGSNVVQYGQELRWHFGILFNFDL